MSYAKAETWDDYYYGTEDGLRDIWDGYEYWPPQRKGETMSTELIEAPQQTRVPSISELAHDDQMNLAKAIASTLVQFVDEHKLAVKLGKGERRYCMVEGWNFMGQQLGLFARQSKEPVQDTDANGHERWKAYVEIVDRAGNVVSSAWHQCCRSEKNWASRDSYALQSMATTRATGKAFRQNWSWVMRMHGFEVTPYEEIPPEDENPKPAAKPAKPKKGKQSEAAAVLIATLKRRGEAGDMAGIQEISADFVKQRQTFSAADQAAIIEAGKAAKAHAESVMEAETRSEELFSG